MSSGYRQSTYTKALLELIRSIDNGGLRIKTKKNLFYDAADRQVAGLYIEIRASMKRNLKIGRVKIGQAFIIFFLVFCITAGSVLAFYHLRRMNFGETSAKAGEMEKNDSTYVKKSFPYNRYYNEVLMY